MKIRKQKYGNKNLVGKNIEHLRKEKGIKQKDFIAQIQVMGCDMNPPVIRNSKDRLGVRQIRNFMLYQKFLVCLLKNCLIMKNSI